MKKLKFIPILLALITGTCFAETLQDQVYVYDDFSKGLNLKLSSLSLPKSQAIIAENVRYNTELKALSKRKEVFSYGSTGSEASTGQHRLYLKDGTKKFLQTHGDELESGNDATGAFTNLLTFTTGDYRWQFVTWHDVAIGCDGHNQPIKTNGTVATYLGSCGAADSGVDGVGADPNGTYTYKVSYYGVGFEILFNQVSNSVTVANHDINLSMIPIAPDTYSGTDVTGRKIYRNKTGGSTWYLLSNGTIDNNTATTLTDSDDDGSLLVTAYPGGTATYTPPKGRFPIVHHNRLWFANDPNHPSRIYYSEDGSPDVFIGSSGACTSYFNIRLNDGDEITFAENLFGQFCIGKNNSIQYIDTFKGDSPTADWEVTDPFSFIGCDAPYSVDNSPLGIIYLDWSGLYKFNGKYSTLISDAITPVILDISETDFENCWGKFHKNIFYLAYTSEATGSSTNDKVLVFDLLSNAYSIDSLSINTFCTFSSGDDWDILYAGSSANGTVYAYAETPHGIIHRRHSDFTGTWGAENARYIPTKWGGDSDSPTLEIARRTTIDNLSGTINALTGDINREGTTGHYTSQVLKCGATKFDKLYWHEAIPACGGDVVFYLRSGHTSALCQANTWTGPYTNPAGSDISSDHPEDYIQYNIRMTTNDIDYTPTVYTTGGYTVKLTYDIEGATQETTVPLHWRGGWDNLGYPGRMKTLKYLECYYDYEEGASGTLDIKFENWEGDTDTFEIDLLAEGGHYEEGFTNQALLGKLFRLDLTESSLNSLTIRKILVTYDIEPLDFIFGE